MESEEGSYNDGAQGIGSRVTNNVGQMKVPVVSIYESVANAAFTCLQQWLRQSFGGPATLCSPHDQ